MSTRALAAIVLALAVAFLGIYGMGRSLWLDEAWVANSIQARSLPGMFYYPDWLQVNPPLFLLLARGAVQVLGASNWAFRAVPLLLAVTAAASMLGVSRRLLRPGFAMLAAAVVAFDPTAIEYSRTLKPYSGELAATALLLLASVRYLQQLDRRRYLWLLATVAAAMPLAYPAVFIVPGIVLAVAAGESSERLRRSTGLAALASGILLGMYWFSIRPNLAPELRDFWAVDVDHGMTAGLWAALIFCVAAAIRAALRRDLAAIVCALPCLLLAASGALGWYPVSHRTRLFALPCFTLLAMMTAQDLLRRWLNHGAIQVTAVALAIGIGGHAAASQVIEHRAIAEEDFAAAVGLLQERVGPNDLVLVHACCKEGFLLYSAMDRWNPPRVLYGDTGWPCCARGKDARPGISTRGAVIADLDAKIPRGFSGRIWLLYTTRPTQWTYVGLNEGELWRNHLWERGCPPGPYLRFENLAVSPIDCVNAR